MFRSYCLTVRPLDGISDETTNQIKKWLSKMPYAVAVLEKETHERHLHAQIWCDTPKARGDICKQVQRICERSIKEWSSAQLKVLRSGVKIAYSDWYLDYLVDNSDKEPPNIIINNPPGKSMEYYPTEEEQEDIQTLKTAVDPRFADLEIKCRDYLGERTITERTVASFLADAMFNQRTLKCVIQQRDRIALAKTLFAYMSKSTDIYLFLPKEQEQIKFENSSKKFSQYILQECLESIPDPSCQEDAPLMSQDYGETTDEEEETL